MADDDTQQHLPNGIGLSSGSFLPVPHLLAYSRTSSPRSVVPKMVSSSSVFSKSSCLGGKSRLLVKRDESLYGSVVGFLYLRWKKACRQLAVRPVVSYAFAAFAFYVAVVGAGAVSKVDLEVRAFHAQRLPHLSSPITQTNIRTLPSTTRRLELGIPKVLRSTDSLSGHLEPQILFKMLP